MNGVGGGNERTFVSRFYTLHSVMTSKGVAVVGQAETPRTGDPK